MSFANVKFSGEINTKAMRNVAVGNFSILDSNIERIEHEAFDLTVTEKFVIKRTRIEHIEDHAFYNIRSAKSSAFPVVSLVKVSTFDVEVDGFKIRDEIKVGEISNITYKTDCHCDMYKLSGSGDSHSHNPMNSAHSSNISNTLLNFISCEYHGTSIRWSKFDTDHCDEDHDHAGDGIYIPNILGLDKNIFLGIVIGAGVIFVIGLLLHFGKQLKIPGILI